MWIYKLNIVFPVDLNIRERSRNLGAGVDCTPQTGFHSLHHSRCIYGNTALEYTI